MLKKIIGTIWRTMPPPLRMIVIRTTQRKFTVSVAAVIINEKGEVLLLDHVLRPASSWGIPGGFIESGEQPIDAVKRELREEVGIELTDVQIFRARTIYRHVEILFRARSAGKPEVKSREINAARWFNPNELPKNMSRSHREIIEKLLKEPFVIEIQNR
jgi:8-oxo-dGTP diphosphatase